VRRVRLDGRDKPLDIKKSADLSLSLLSLLLILISAAATGSLNGRRFILNPSEGRIRD
jgi:hypothetical protein